MTTPPKMLTPSEVSEYFGGNISVRTLDNWRSQGKGPKYLKLQGTILYPLTDLEQWVEEQKHDPSTKNK